MKIFNGFALDMASDVTGLSKGEIRWLIKQKILSPKKVAGGYQYTFSELLMLRLVRLLKMNRVRVKNIKRAREYIKGVDPSKDLTNMKLYVQANTQEILYIGEHPQDGIHVNMSEFGQLVASNLLEILPVGRDLEHMRRGVLDLDETLSSRVSSKDLIPADDVLKLYGIA
ncbi:MAG: MerR family transcriptional regulator [Candidatus Obscuribacterales bacterium]|nr:MerR family transcriptional regulator [Candidatus Obscuribacterales bacterium]